MATLTRATTQLKINPTLTLEGPEVLGQSLSPSELNPADTTYSPTTTPPASQYYAEEITLSGSGASDETITLDSWTDTEGRTKSSTGLKVNVLRVQPDSANSAVIVIEGGAADPYELFGSGNAVEFPAGSDMEFEFNDKLDDVGPASGGGATDIKVSGTGGDIVTIEMLIG